MCHSETHIIETRTADEPQPAFVFRKTRICYYETHIIKTHIRSFKMYNLNRKVYFNI